MGGGGGGGWGDTTVSRFFSDLVTPTFFSFRSLIIKRTIIKKFF